MATFASGIPRASAGHDFHANAINLGLHLLETFVIRPAIAGPAHWTRIDCDIVPEEARVEVDGEYVGIADEFDGWPSYLWVPPGRYTLRFSHPSRESRTIEIHARPGEEIELMEVLSHRNRDTDRWHPSRDTHRFATRDANRSHRPSRARSRSAQRAEQRPAWIRLDVRQSDAAMYIDGRYVGVSPLAEGGVELEPGPHIIEVTKPGFETWRGEIRAKPGWNREIEIRLRPTR